ncbi:helix-turn-helix transcriptional regulator [Corynebacterium bovis]|uniref:helix-turn-helix domain-containing protein n=1 Tax=Corynebacterium bovis TaxID=36808 RepID=UPI0025509C45|nr:helix-turn-helix transcriptional regulator [Corynebacterium bovis]MDK8511413.1 helix-turn-helix transcriptional regulator [Corynebacterium bovis]
MDDADAREPYPGDRSGPRAGSPSGERSGGFARRLRHARCDRGLSQAGLASGICSPSAVSRWESGRGVPQPEVLRALADRLWMAVPVLTGEGFDSRLAESPDGFGAVVAAAFGGDTGGSHSAIAGWVGRVREVLDAATSAPHARGVRSGQPSGLLSLRDARHTVDDLMVDPLTAATPVALETVELLDALVTLEEEPTAGSVDRLVDTLTWTGDAPEPLRRTAVEVAVAAFVEADMPVAAHAVVTRVAPPEVTPTTAVLLTWSGMRAGDVPPAAGRGSARDGLVALLATLRSRGGPVPPGVVDAVVEASQGDRLVALLAQRLPPAAD